VIEGRRLQVVTLTLSLLLVTSIVLAQGANGSIKGRATDSAGGVLPGAIVTVTPKGGSTVTDNQGEYAMTGLAPGDYAVNVNYLGFNVFTKPVTLAAGQSLRVDATLEVATVSEQVLVTAVRPRGEAEQINRQRTAENIVQVLSADVITSLPNANIADALGRLPSVTLERDEGEGKYVQIRGTEPRLSNTTIDGVTIPSPESGVRQIKLDTLASDLVESIEINKTLQANMDADGIGGSVNLRTKTAGEQPTMMLSGLGGYTPIIGGRGVSRFNTTVGERFGSSKNIGVLMGGTYDWNGRGINDIEPSPTVSSVSQRYLFPVYNADVAGVRLGAPLLRSVPFYTVIANHDVQGKDANGNEIADFTRNPDALAYYTAMHLPLNGSQMPAYPTPTMGPAERIATFKACAGPRFPGMANYSFDYGDAPFLCLDSNRYIDPNDRALQDWIAADLTATDALWTFVVFHHPPFNVGNEHYEVQHMRVLAPLFEAHDVDFVLSGHEHTYQRARPLRFSPNGAAKSADLGGKDRRVPGTFTVDRRFDGMSQTRPDGILYIVTGAGGKHLYDPGFTDNPALWTHADDDHADYVAKMVTDRHSLSVFDIDGGHLTMVQIDEAGEEIDRIVVTKLDDRGVPHTSASTMSRRSLRAR
jgi:Carboxypeptidase regulatory-like domain/TonB-dependent Receptor Plug Domain/Calcineurin-like phosphoesterase